MRSENFVAFFTISGFFIGLSFSLLKSQNLTEFIFFQFSITFFFYIFIHLVLIFFFSVEPNIKDSFNKVESEAIVNLQINQLKERERLIEEIRVNINDLKK
jgi:bacteriorhodopsin